MNIIINISKFIHAYLTDRSIIVKVNNALAPKYLSGPSWPLLYLIYIHCFRPPNHPLSKCLLYANGSPKFRPTYHMNPKSAEQVFRLVHQMEDLTEPTKDPTFIIFKHPHSERLTQDYFRNISINLL